jgi:hypothetical protein
MDRRERERLLTSSSSHFFFFFFFFFFFSLVLCVYKCAPPRYQLSLSLSVQREFVNINPKLIFALTKQPADNSHKFYFSLPHTTRARTRTHKQQTKRTEEEEEEEK